MTDETTTAVPFHYIKGNFFRVTHVDGVIGNVTPAGLIFLGFYSERVAIPQIMVHEITAAGQVGEERAESRVGKAGIVRELDSGAVMAVETATALVTWLQNQIDLAQRMRETAKAEKVQHGNI